MAKMKRYFVKYGKFRNQYALRYISDPERPTPEGWERIHRKEAEALARAERARRKDNPAFSGYADAEITEM